MTRQRTAVDLATGLAARADAVLKEGKPDQARLLYADAAEATIRAVNDTPEEKTRSRALLMGNVAVLWYKACQFEAAIATARAYLNDGAPNFARPRLQEVILASEEALGLAASHNVRQKPSTGTAVDRTRRSVAAGKARQGILFCADIKGFSGMEPKLQVGAIRHLWNSLRRHDRQRAEPRYTWHLPGRTTSDALVVAMSNVTHEIQFRQLLELAISLTATCLEHSIPVRVGLHAGLFSLVKALGSSFDVVVGSGPNQCARIASIGDGGDIIASDRFVKIWSVLSEFPRPEEFYPAEDRSAIQVFFPDAASERVRIFRGFGSSETLPELRSPAHVPSRLAQLAKFDGLVHQLLRQIEAELLGGLGFHFDGYSERDRVSARISVVAQCVLDNEPVLAATEFRYHYEQEAVGRGRTIYRLADKGQGPPGRAFVSRVPVVVSRLPDFEADPEAYVCALEPWGVPHDMIAQSWQRCARSFICFPFGLTRDAPHGVLCIDMADPLEEISEENLGIVATVLYQAYADRLAGLWALRVQQKESPAAHGSAEWDDSSLGHLFENPNVALRGAMIDARFEFLRNRTLLPQPESLEQLELTEVFRI